MGDRKTDDGEQMTDFKDCVNEGIDLQGCPILIGLRLPLKGYKLSSTPTILLFAVGADLRVCPLKLVLKMSCT